MPECKSCGAQIRLAETRYGRRVALDVAAHPDGELMLTPRADRAPLATRHFGAFPDRERFGEHRCPAP